MFHALSFRFSSCRCSICNKLMQVSGAGSMEGKVSHKKCFAEQFKVKKTLWRFTSLKSLSRHVPQETGGKYGGVKVTKVADKDAAAAQVCLHILFSSFLLLCRFFVDAILFC